MGKRVCTECGLDIQDGEYFFQMELHQMIQGEGIPEGNPPIYIHTGCFLSKEED